jgi:hypothetical protein
MCLSTCRIVCQSLHHSDVHTSPPAGLWANLAAGGELDALRGLNLADHIADLDIDTSRARGGAAGGPQPK